MSASIECRACPGAAHELFSCLSHEQRARLARAAVPHLYHPQESLFHSGTPALALYCVRSGTIKLFRWLHNGDQVVVGARGAGDLLGMRALLTETPFATTATALEPSIVCTIPRESVLELVCESSAMGYQLLKRLARDSCMLEDQLVERTHDRVGKRTARFLLQQMRGHKTEASRPEPIGLSMSREEMAQFVGTTPETLSRTLHRFAADGILDVERRQIRVLNISALMRAAG